MSDDSQNDVYDAETHCAACETKEYTSAGDKWICFNCGEDAPSAFSKPGTYDMSDLVFLRPYLCLDSFQMMYAHEKYKQEIIEPPLPQEKADE